MNKVLASEKMNVKELKRSMKGRNARLTDAWLTFEEGESVSEVSRVFKDAVTQIRLTTISFWS